MPREILCPVCKKAIDKTKDFNYKGTLWYHEKCWNKFVKGEQKEAKKVIEERIDKQQVEAIKAKLEKESLVTDITPLSDDEIRAKEKVVQYLKTLTRSEYLDVKVYKLLKDYYNNYHYSYIGMYLALRYFYEIKGNPPYGDCVGIIPSIYREAQALEKLKKKIEKDAESIDFSKVVVEKTVQISSPKNQLKKDFINIEEIGV